MPKCDFNKVESLLSAASIIFQKSVIACNNIFYDLR